MAPPGFGHQLPLPYVAAHRGARRLAPENTLAAFSAAIDSGALGIELDVHLSADGRVVVIHDDLLDRTTDGQGPVSEVSYDDLRKLDAGSWWSAEFSGERLPLLEEVFELAQSQTVLHVELKGQAVDTLAAEVVNLARRFSASQRVLAMSFNLEAVLAVRRLAADIPALPIVGKALPDPVAFVEEMGLSGLNQAVGRWGPSAVGEFHERGWLVHGSLVNSREEVAGFFARGGDMVDSDEPGCFREDRT